MILSDHIQFTYYIRLVSYRQLLTCGRMHFRVELPHRNCQGSASEGRDRGQDVKFDCPLVLSSHLPTTPG